MKHKAATATAAPLTDDEARHAGELSLKLAHALKGRRAIRLKLADSQHELPLPAGTAPLLLEILNQLSKGKTVRVLADDTEISAQRAADLLHVSRPFLIGLLTKNEIPRWRVGTHRRLKLADVLTYKHRIDEQRMAALDELTRMSQELGLGYE